MRRLLPLLFILSPILLVAQTPMWRQVGPTGSISITALQALPGGTLLVGAPAGIFRSTDRGATWSSVTARVLDVAAIERDSSGVAFAATSAGLYRSNDDGASWSLLAFRDSSVDGLAVARDGTIYLVSGNASHGDRFVFRSDDDGTSWHALDSLTSLGYSVGRERVSTLHDSIVVVGTVTDLWRTSDRGATWRHLHSNPIPIPVVGESSEAGCNSVVALDSGVSIGSWGRLLVRRDSAGEWLPASFAPLDPGVNTLLRLDDSSALAGLVWNGIWRSTDRGTTWRPVGLAKSDVTHLASAPDGHLYARAAGGLFRSSDRGATWDRLILSIPIAHVDKLLAAKGDRIYSTSDIGPLLSTDRGITWTPTDASMLYLTADRHGELATIDIRRFLLRRSNDGGVTWTDSPIDDTLGGSIGRFASMGNGLLFVRRLGDDYGTIGFREGSLWRSTNSGAAWKRVSESFGMVEMVQASDGTLFAGLAAERFHQYQLGEHRGVFTSTDDGATWQRLDTGHDIGQVSSMILVGDSTLLVGTRWNGVWRSSTRGATWERANNGLSDLSTHSIVRNAAGTIYLSTQLGGVYTSTDDGASWQSTNDGLWFDRVGPLALDSASYLYAGTRGASIFRTNGPTVSVDKTEMVWDDPLHLLATPTPFEKSTTIVLQLSKRQSLRVSAFDVSGREMMVLHDGYLDAGWHWLRFDAEELPLGAYRIVVASDGTSRSIWSVKRR